MIVCRIEVLLHLYFPHLNVIVQSIIKANDVLIVLFIPYVVSNNKFVEFVVFAFFRKDLFGLQTVQKGVIFVDRVFVLIYELIDELAFTGISIDGFYLLFIFDNGANYSIRIII